MDALRISIPRPHAANRLKPLSCGYAIPLDISWTLYPSVRYDLLLGDAGSGSRAILTDVPPMRDMENETLPRFLIV